MALPNTFVQDTKAEASEVNENFDYLEAERIYSGADAGGDDDYVITTGKNLAAYRTRMFIVITVATAGASGATVNVDTLGVKNIKRLDGSDLQDGDMPAGTHVLMYDGTNFVLVGAFDPFMVKAKATDVDSVNDDGTYDTAISKTIPGGMLGTEHGIRLRCYIVTTTSSGDGCNCRLKLGSTTLCTFALQVTAFSGEDDHHTLEFEIFNNASASVQVGLLRGIVARDVSAVGVQSQSNQETYMGELSAAEDTSADRALTLEFAATGGGSSAWNVVLASVELVKAN